MGHPKSGFLDQDEYDGIFAVAEELNVLFIYTFSSSKRCLPSLLQR